MAETRSAVVGGGGRGWGGKEAGDREEVAAATTRRGQGRRQAAAGEKGAGAAAAMGISELGFSWVDEDEREGERNEVWCRLLLDPGASDGANP